MPIVHPLVVRICHWINAVAILAMLLSGWRIYDASPLFKFSFPAELTLGGWLAGALQWHFAAMWLLASSSLVYILFGLFSGHYRRNLLPFTPGTILQAFRDLLHGHLSHRPGSYNPLQKAAYILAIALTLTLILSGAALWKPVQLQGLAGIFGGYEGTRLVHFFAMAGIVAFTLVHVAMALLVPRTLPPMFTGRKA